MSDTTTDQRVCVTCDQPIRLARDSQTHYEHLDPHAATVDRRPHEAQPKLAHPMDQDPFAGVDGE